MSGLWRAVLASVLVAVALSVGATAEQASQPSSPAAGQIDVGGSHTCAIIAGDVRCWGLGFSGQLGYGNTSNVGDDEAPGSLGYVNLGPGRTATAISVGVFHSCAVLDNGSVRCWGSGAAGRLGYGNTNNIGDTETPDTAGPVELGAGRTATAITAGGAHTCAILDDGSVRCWGLGAGGRLGYGNTNDIGDNESPGSAGPVDLGTGRTAIAISAGEQHTCAVLDNGSVRCWGQSGTLPNGDGRLGYGNPLLQVVGDNETPGSVGPVDLGAGRTATAISAGEAHTCALLDNGTVRCWGWGERGRLGYNSTTSVGDDETPGTVGPVDLGAGHTATAVGVGSHSCARLDDGSVRCWGPGVDGRLGYGNVSNIGDNEHPGGFGPVNLGAGRTAVALSLGPAHTCVSLDDATLRCWGEGLNGRLGYGNTLNVGLFISPAEAGPVPYKSRATIGDGAVTEGATGQRTVSFTVRLSWPSRETASVAYATADGTARAPADYTPVGGTVEFAPGETSKVVTVPVRGDAVDERDERFLVNLSNPVNLGIADPQAAGTIADDDVTATSPTPPAVDGYAAAVRAQQSRRRGLRGCQARARRHTTRETRRTRRLEGARRTRARRHARRHGRRLRRACLARWGRTPGSVTGPAARAGAGGRVVLTFGAAGTDGNRQPAAAAYVVKQARRPIRSARAFRRAKSLCGGTCRFPQATRVGDTATLTVTDLRPGVYHYSVAARDNVSRRLGPRSRAVGVRVP